jgi:hypothetical protein
MINDEFFFLGAISRFLLYLFGHGLRFAPSATKKDVATIGAMVVKLMTSETSTIIEISALSNIS